MSHIHERKSKRYWESDKGTIYTNYDCERRLAAAIWAVSRWAHGTQRVLHAFARTLETRTTYPPREGSWKNSRNTRGAAPLLHGQDAVVCMRCHLVRTVADDAPREEER